MASIGDRVTIRVKGFLAVNGRIIANTLNESGFNMSFIVGSGLLITSIDEGVRGMNIGDIARINVDQSEVRQYYFDVELLELEWP